MAESQLEREARNVYLEGGNSIDYIKSWTILAVANETNPCGVTVNPHNGHIYAAVKSGIVEYDLAGKLVNRHRSNDEPNSVTFEEEEKMIVTSFKNNCVKIYNCEVEFLSQFGSIGRGEKEFDKPCDAACDSDGRLYIADWNNKRIQVYKNSDGDFMKSISKKMDKPTFVIIDNNNKTSTDGSRLLVSDYNNNTIVEFVVKGDTHEFVRKIAVHHPRGICQDKDGNILVASANKVIFIFDKNWKELAAITEPKEALNDIWDIVITSCGVLCVTSFRKGNIYFLHQPNE